MLLHDYKSYNKLSSVVVKKFQTLPLKHFKGSPLLEGKNWSRGLIPCSLYQRHHDSIVDEWPSQTCAVTLTCWHFVETHLVAQARTSSLC